MDYDDAGNPMAGSCLVAAGAAIHRLLLPDAADVKERFDLEATGQAVRLVLSGTIAACGEAGGRLSRTSAGGFVDVGDEPEVPAPRGASRARPP